MFLSVFFYAKLDTKFWAAQSNNSFVFCRLTNEVRVCDYSQKMFVKFYFLVALMASSGYGNENSSNFNFNLSKNSLTFI